MLKIFLLLVFVLSTLSASKCSIKTTIPINAEKYMDLVYNKVSTVIPEVSPTIFGSLIEQESCVRICGNGYWAKRCWSPISELKNDREQGVGFGQITRTWRKDGSVRFDTLRNLKRKYPKELKELTWDNIKEKPELQAVAMVLLWRDNFRYFKDVPLLEDRIAFADSAYNGGFRFLNKERSRCKFTDGCDPNKWFGNVEITTSARASSKMYGRTAWDINREHVRNVMKVRGNKYKQDYLLKIINDLPLNNIDGNLTKFYGE